MANSPKWTTAEIRLLETLAGMNYREVATYFPTRSARAISIMRTRIHKARKGIKTKEASLAPLIKDIPQISPEQRASEKLRIATLKAIVSYANDNGLGVDDAARRLLSHA